MKKLSIIDTAFLLAESRETPMHVGSFNLFTLPDGADEQIFLHELADGLRTADQLQSPFGEKLKMGRRGLLGPVYWEEDTALDLDYHIRHSALPKPGRFREAFALISRLHGTLLDRSRPLWEMHLIEGLQDRQFAVYSKFHHAAIDGVRSTHLLQSMWSKDPGTRIHDSPLSLSMRERYLAGLGVSPPEDEELRNVAEALKVTFDSGANLLGALRKYVGAWTGANDSLVVPWQRVPHSAINTHVDGARRFVAQSWPFERIRAVAKALDGTFNDAVLAMCAGALRLFLLNHGELPRESLKSMVPVSLRRPGDIDSSNAVGAISADLATDIADPVQRFRKISASMDAGKDSFRGLSPSEAALFLQLQQFPALLMLPLGLATRYPPYNTIISNVPGPRDTLYWNGARLEGIYPTSIVTEGIAMNITLVTYARDVHFGIMACRRTLPQIQRFIDYLEDALVELEDATGISSSGKPVKKKRTAKKQARKRGSAGVKAQGKSVGSAKPAEKRRTVKKAASPGGKKPAGKRTPRAASPKKTPD